MKKTTLLTMAVVAAVSLTANAQAPGPWDATGGIAQTTTPHQVQIGAGAGALNAWAHIRYCDPNDYGLVVTKAFCGYPDVVTARITYDGVIDQWLPDGDPPPPVVFVSPINFSLTGYSSFLEKPILWLRQEQASGISGSSGTHNSRMIVTPHGKSGFNIENPRATMDIKSLGGFNDPVMILGRQKPGTVDKTQHIHFVPYLNVNGYNQIVEKYDQGLFFTDGQGTEGANLTGDFVIAPWANQADPSIGGLRITQDGDLEVHGDIKATKVTVTVQWWSDFVFNDEYVLSSLYDVEEFIKINKHLPGVPSEADLMKNGLDIGTMQAIHMKKIEELTLYTIDQQKKIDELESKLTELASKLEQISK